MRIERPNRKDSGLPCKRHAAEAGLILKQTRRQGTVLLAWKELKLEHEVNIPVRSNMMLDLSVGKLS